MQLPRGRWSEAELGDRQCEPKGSIELWGEGRKGGRKVEALSRYGSLETAGSRSAGRCFRRHSTEQSHKYNRPVPQNPDSELGLALLAAHPRGQLLPSELDALVSQVEAALRQSGGHC